MHVLGTSLTEMVFKVLTVKVAGLINREKQVFASFRSLAFLAGNATSRLAGVGCDPSHRAAQAPTPPPSARRNGSGTQARWRAQGLEREGGACADLLK